MQDEDITMHCPGCGAKAPLDQKFCRSCGFALEKVLQLVAEQRSSPDLLHETNRLAKRQRKIEQSLFVAGFGFVALILISMLSGLIYLMAVGNLPLVPGSILLLLMLTGIVAGSLATYSERLKASLSSSKKQEQLALQEPPSVASRETQFVSITERTTNLLEAGLNKNEAGSERERGS